MQQAWVSPVTSCKGVAFDIVNAEESASEAWAKLVQHYRASGLKERRRLTIDFYMTKMELGEHPRKFLLRVYQMVNELERVDRPVNPKDIDIVILSGLTPQYDVEVRMLESLSDWPMWERIERSVIGQYERLESEKFAAGSRAMLSARGHRRNDTPPTRCPLCSCTRHSALKCREFQITRREKKPNACQRDGEHGGNGGGGRNGGGSRNGGGGGNGRGGERGGGGGNLGGGGSKTRRGGRGNVRTNFEVGPLVATTARPALAARGAPRERHEDEYWVADSGATKNMTQYSFNLEDYTPAPPGDEVESAGGGFLPVAGCGRLRLLVDQDKATFKGATRELTLDRVAHVPKLGRHNLLSTKRLTTAFDAPMRVYPTATTIRPRFGRETFVFHSLRPETGLLEIKARRRADMKEPQTPLTAARSTATASANNTRAQVSATRGQVHRA